MAIQEPKNLTEFEQLINSNSLVVVDFHATWCGPCKLIAPKFKAFAEETANVVFAKIDVDEVPDVATKYQVRAMPTIMYFKDGNKVDEVVGANVANIKAKLDALAA
ncbi:thioredoxin-like protein [Mycotypha africana]|uniref:thioredoxin-like protein n=1 Tax=Mycotypha africana TaxID=64632 RepID=UPI0022FFE04A|nr:thioredoxin-like protein [Mycotypha africana]KAI8977265.1 thioredoxin-like protein [Mycotypha africana]